MGIKKEKNPVKKSTYKATEIVYKQIGRNLNVKIRKELYTKVGTTEELKPIKELIDRFNSTTSLLAAEKLEIRIIDTLTANKKAEVKKEEDKKIIAKAKVKTLDKKLKETEQLDTDNSKILRKLLPKDLFSVSDMGEVTLVNTVTVMPQLLVDKILKFIEQNKSLSPLLNFWKLVLINPNYKIIPKLFDYISRHNLIITPSGCFVTYRMVKSTDRKNSDGKPIYTSAHTGKEDYIIGEIYKLDRKDCDDNGARDCSNGLHTGSADFIGIKLGDGYNKGEIKTKAQGGGYGTGYDAPDEMFTQKFDNTFGNVAVICIVNPMNVVSVPNSDTRKMRSCELYFAKVTTAEEVLHHLTDEDYLIYDTNYTAKQVSELEVELAELNIKTKNKGLFNFFKNDSKKEEAKKALEIKKKKLQEELALYRLQLDNVRSNNNIISDDIINIMKNRIVID